MKATNQVKQMLNARRLKLPARPVVIDIIPEPYVDSLGDEALRILVVLGNDTTDEELSADRMRPIETAITDALNAAGITLFPYIFLTTEDEHAQQAGR